MFAWLATAGAGQLARWIWIGIAAAIVTAVILIADNAVEDVLTGANDTGRSEARADQAQATINKMEKANAASDDLHRDPGIADDECLRNARNPADC